MYKFIFFVISLLIFSCSSEKEEKTIKKTVKKEIKKVPKFRELKKENKYNVQEIEELNISIEIPENFKKRDNIFFMNNGINISFSEDEINDNFSLKEYAKKVYNDIKKEYSNIVVDQEEVIVNNKKSLILKYILDRKKYFVQIQSVLIRNKNKIIILSITGKKKDMEKYQEMINTIIVSILLKEKK